MDTRETQETRTFLDTRCFRVVRFYQDSGRREVVAENLTLWEAQDHCRCRDPEASSRTCTSTEGGAWFDGYELVEK